MPPTEADARGWPVPVINFNFYESPSADLANEVKALRLQVIALTNAVNQQTQSFQHLEAEVAVDATRILSEVEQARTAQESARILIGDLAQQMRDLAAEVATDAAVQDALNAAADQLDSSSGALSAAVEANTPGAPETPPAEPPVEEPPVGEPPA